MADPKASCTWPPPLGSSGSLSLFLLSPRPTTPVSSPALFQLHNHTLFYNNQCPVTPWVSSLPTRDLPLSTGKLIHRQQGLPSFPGNTSPSPGVTRACLCQLLSNWRRLSASPSAWRASLRNLVSSLFPSPAQTGLEGRKWASGCFSPAASTDGLP